MTPILILLIVSVPLLWWGHRRRQAQQRELFIDEYEFPESVVIKFRRQYPELRDADVAKVAQGLRQFFQIHRRTHPLPIGMPSKVVDELWHQFILDTRAYRAFCDQAFGHFFHHVPAGAVPAGQHVSQDLRRTWREACRLDGLSIATAASLPLLFQLDQQLRVPEGNRFQPHASWVAAGAGGDSSSFMSSSSSSSTSSCGGVACSGGRHASDDSSGGNQGTDCSTDNGGSSGSSTNDSSCSDSSSGGDSSCSGSSCGGGCGGGGGD